MKEAIIYQGLKVRVLDESPIPLPGPQEVIIKVVVAATNPIDWKSTTREEEIKLHGEIEIKGYKSTGKDVTGLVHSVGPGITEFKVGDRVGATNHGSGYAEYSVGPSHTTFRIPDSMSFEDTATYGLPYITAALGLYHHMQLPAPWTPTKARTPIIIYGASSAVGAFAVKLASLSNLHPIIAVSGQGSDYVKSIIDPSKGDVVVDYRQGEEKLLALILKAIHRDEKIKYAFDAISIPSTINFLGRAIDSENGVLGTVLQQEEGLDIPSGVQMSLVFAPELWSPIVHTKQVDKRDSITNRESGFVFFRYLEYTLANELIKPHPSEVIPGGLAGVEQGLKAVKAGKNSGLKYLYRIADTNV
ncbi:hypothetical protein BP5796_05736 [Coleophoma crateriformis]|uniref:Enoyl reductase (ER) domain-containing protein n=1 Tax=Coleophoma crateriformis TaxID=565419 RepID=A0A3D8RVJ0_9HELO|nr:hypothetical protein BP5796_05736 [Coleophoma crateriformis]